MVPVVLVLVPGVLLLSISVFVIRDIMCLGRGPVVRACQIVPHQKHVRRWVPVGRVRITNVPRTKVRSVINLVRSDAVVITQAHVQRTHHVHITPVITTLAHNIMAVRAMPAVRARSAPYHVILDTIKMAVRVLAVPRSVPVAI